MQANKTFECRSNQAAVKAAPQQVQTQVRLWARRNQIKLVFKCIPGTTNNGCLIQHHKITTNKNRNKGFDYHVSAWQNDASPQNKVADHLWSPASYARASNSVQRSLELMANKQWELWANLIFSAAFGSATKRSFSPTEFANVQERLEEPGEAASSVKSAAARSTNSSGRKGVYQLSVRQGQASRV